MKRRILAIISPPGDGGIVAQARAIQAHQPDEILLLKTYFAGKSATKTSLRLMAWIRGSRELVETYSELLDVLDLPYTPPYGFLQRRECIGPRVVEIDVLVDDFLAKLLELENTYKDEDFRFDILPGSKRVSTPVLIPGYLLNTKITYSLDQGGFLTLGDSGANTLEAGIHLSLVDRFWLTGMPIYTENNKVSISEFSDLYSALLSAQSIEFRTLADEVREERRKKSIPRKKITDLPLNMHDNIAIQQFNKLGGTINFPVTGKMRYQLNGLTWEIMTEEHDSKLGNYLELIAANEILNHWTDVVEVYQGVSFLTPTIFELRRQIKSLIHRDLTDYQTHPDKTHVSGRFLERCARLGIDIDDEQKDIGLEVLVEAEINYLSSLPQAELLQHIWMLRTAEVDILTLGEFGVSMFDAKQAIWEERHFTTERSATQFPQNVIVREEEKLYVVNSTSPYERENVIHLTQLKKGRSVLGSPNRSQWMPTGWNLELLESIIKEHPPSAKWKKDIEVKTGVETDVLRRLFPETFNLNEDLSRIKIETNDLKTRQEAVDAIGKVFIAQLKDSPCNWGQAIAIINRIISVKQKQVFFGSKKFTLSHARKFLGEYIEIIGNGNDAIVHPVNT